jgi:MFS family permease
VASAHEDSPYSWLRLAVSVLTGTIGGVGMWSVVVALPVMQAEFGVDRASASLPYTMAMVGFAVGGVLIGKLADRFGAAVPVVIAAVALGLGYAGAAMATSIWQFALAHGLLIGLLGASAVFGPLMTDISRWFARRRGIAVAIFDLTGSYRSAFANGFAWNLLNTAIALFLLRRYRGPRVTLLPAIL